MNQLISKTYCKSLFMAAICLGGVVPLWAQTTVYLGKSVDVVAAYKAKANEKALNPLTVNNKITHTLPDKKTLVISVQASKQEGNVVIYAGEVDTTKNSNFFLEVQNNNLTGYIILRDQKKAYQYISKNGLTYLQEVEINKVICIGYEQKLKKNNSFNQGVRTDVATAIPNLQSLPGAPSVVLLDFDGQYVWDLHWSPAPIDAAPANLTEVEMVEVWKIMSEDFRPFNLNVTTNESVYANAPSYNRMRVIFTPTKYFTNPKYGGVALISSWGDGIPCWVFNDDIKGAGDCGSHEVGHTLSLEHDGRTAPFSEEYFEGQDNWAPIMGSSYTRLQAQWSKGEYPYANNKQDDLAEITRPIRVFSPGVTYRADDHSNSGVGATSIIKDAFGNVSPSINKGVISTRSDVDVFSFTTTGGSASFTVNPIPSYPNLDVLLTLKNSLGAVIAISNPATVFASVSIASLAAGSYYLYIDGATGSLGANSDYGSLGEYSISGNFVPPGRYVLNTSPQTTCSGTFYDPGYTNNYPHNLDIAQTFTPAIPGNKVSVTFSSFNLEDNNDFLLVHDGDNWMNTWPMGIYTGSANPGTVTATNPSGKLTFRFMSNSSVTASGWQASISCVPPVIAQWNHRFGTTGNDFLTTSIKTADGGYLLGGYTNSGSGGDKTETSRGGIDYWILKLSGSGIKEWDKRFGGTADDSLTAIVQTSDGGYLLGGNSASGPGGDKTETSRGGADYWVLKISGSGIRQWDKRFGSSGSDNLSNIILTTDGGFLLTGSASGSGGDKTESSRGGIDYWVVKISGSGTRQWDKRFGGINGDFGKAAVQTTDGGYLIAGYSNSGMSGDKSQDNRGDIFSTDYWIVKISGTGAKQWDKRFGGGYSEVLSSVIASGDGGYLLGGSSSSGIGGDKTTANRGTTSPNGEWIGYKNDYWIVKTDANGSRIWDKDFGGSDADDASSMIKTADGGYLIGGSSLSGVSGDKTETSRGNKDYWIVKVSSNGVRQWEKRFGGTAEDALHCVMQAPDNGYILAGKSLSGVGGDKTESSRGGADYWILKTTAPTGTFPTIVADGVTTVQTSKITDVIKKGELSFNTSFNAAPNPFTAKVTLSFTLPEAQYVSLKVYDVHGRAVATIYNGNAQAGKNYTFDLGSGNMKPGVYFARLVAADKENVLKLVLIK